MRTWWFTVDQVKFSVRTQPRLPLGRTGSSTSAHSLPGQVWSTRSTKRLPRNV